MAVLTIVASALGGCAPNPGAAEKDGWVPLDLKLPHPGFRQPHFLPRDEPNLEEPRRGRRPPFLVPPGTVNLAAHRRVTSSDEEPIIGSLDLVTDNDKSPGERYVELGPDRQWVQIDLEQRAPIHAIAIWHDWEAEYNYIVYRDVIVQVSDDPAFRCRVQTLFSNDHDNSSGLGRGKEKAYVETHEGKLIDAGGVRARYVRLYSNGNSSNELNRYTEVSVYGRGQAKPPPPLTPLGTLRPGPQTIHEAAERGDAAAVARFLADGIPPDARDKQGRTALHCAANRREADVARLLLTKGADPNLRDSFGWSPLDSAAFRGNAALVKVFLAHHAKPNARARDGQTALHSAAILGRKEAVGILLTHGADPHAVDSSGESPLHVAAAGGHGSFSSLLLAAGADVNAKTPYGLTPIDKARQRYDRGPHAVDVLRRAGGKRGDQLPSRTLLEVAWRGDEAGLRRLLAAGHDANTQGAYQQFTPLHWACGMRRPKIVRLLLAAGADPDANDSSGQTPLHLLARAAVQAPTAPYSFVHPYGRNAVDKNKMAIRVALAELLLAKGADVNAADKRGRGPLYSAVSTGQVALIRVLLASGAKVQSEADGWTALHEAVRWRDTAAARLLLEAKADANATGRFGDTPLHMAAWDGDVEMAGLLLAYGANINAASGYDGGTPLCVAAEAGEKELSDLLIARGAKVNAMTNRGDTALHLAAYAGHEAVVRLLLANGAQVNVRDRKHETPLDLAINAREHAIAKLLRERGAKMGRVLKAEGVFRPR